MARHNRSISIPIVLGSITILLSITLLIGWTLLILRYRAVTNDFTNDSWLLFSGVASFGLIVVVLVLFVVFLVREILEVRRQNSFIDSVTHELRSPLASLKLCLQTLQRTALPKEKVEQFQTMMVEDVDRLSMFIDHVLVASRLQFGKRTYEVSELRLGDLIEEGVLRIAKRYKLALSVFEVDVPEQLVLVSDATALEVVVTNLLDNAVKYSEREVQIQIQGREIDGGFLELRFKDKGIGIPPKALNKIFDRFYRVPMETVNSRRGTGLGLFVVASLVKSLGGRVKASSRGENQGSTLEVLLPLEAQDASSN